MEEVTAPAALVLLAAFALDGLLGEPPAPLHPVVWIGQAARPLLALRARQLPPRLALLAGGTYTLGLALGAAFGCALLLRALASLPLLAAASEIYLVASLFALNGLVAAGRRLADALDDADLVSAREAVGHLCSRDPSTLGMAGLASAGIESVTENTHDSVVAPLCFYALGGLPALAFYRVLNTLDAMVGYRDDREYLGKVAARLDDVANYVPARLSALLLAVVGGALATLGRRAFHREAAAPPGPNSGWPMAVVASTLHVRLEKPGVYTLGADRPPPSASHLRAALRLVRRASALWLLCVVAFLAWHGGPLVRLWHS